MEQVIGSGKRRPDTPKVAAVKDMKASVSILQRFQSELCRTRKVINGLNEYRVLYRVGSEHNNAVKKLTVLLLKSRLLISISLGIYR